MCQRAVGPRVVASGDAKSGAARLTSPCCAAPTLALASRAPPGARARGCSLESRAPGCDGGRGTCACGEQPCGPCRLADTGRSRAMVASPAPPRDDDSPRGSRSRTDPRRGWPARPCTWRYLRRDGPAVLEAGELPVRGPGAREAGSYRMLSRVSHAGPIRRLRDPWHGRSRRPEWRWSSPLPSWAAPPGCADAAGCPTRGPGTRLRTRPRRRRPTRGSALEGAPDQLAVELRLAVVARDGEHLVAASGT